MGRENLGMMYFVFERCVVNCGFLEVFFFRFFRFGEGLEIGVKISI